MADKTMQWVWKPFYQSLGDDASIFTHVMADHYYQPSLFRVDDTLKNVRSININETSPYFNAE